MTAATPDPSGSSRGTPRLADNERIPVDVPCRYLADQKEVAGRVKHLSREGVFVVSEDDLPAEGGTLHLSVAMRFEGKMARAVLSGTVRWQTAIQHGGRGGGFALKVAKVADGSGGQMFRRFIDQAFRRHQAGEDIPSSSEMDGAEVAPPIYEVGTGGY